MKLKNTCIPLALITLVFLATSCAKLKLIKATGVRTESSSLSPNWVKNLDPEYETGNVPIALGGPLINEGVVYVGNSSNNFDAYSLSNGRLLWREKLEGGTHSAPVIYENLLIYSDVSGRIYGKDLATGEFKYQFDLDSSVDSLIAVAKGRLLVQTRNHKLFSIDALTGKILWSYKRSVPYFSTLQRTSKPLVVENNVYVGFADGYLISFTLEEGQVLWEKKMSTGDKFVDVDMSPTYFRGKLIVSSIFGQAEVLSPSNGNLIKRLPFTTNRDAFLFEDMILFGTLDGHLIGLDSNFNIVKDIKIGETGISSIVNWKGGMVVSTVGKNLYHLNKDFQITSSFDLGTTNSAVFGVMSANDDSLALFSSRNRLYLFK